MGLTDRKFALVFWSNQSLVTGLRMALAAAISFLIYNYLHMQEGYWAIVTIAAVTQVELTGTFIKSLMRILGTIVGAVLGYFLAIYGSHADWFIISTFLVIISITSFIAIQKNIFSYAGTVAGLTTVIVFSSSLIKGELIKLALYRSYEVVLGIVIIGIITMIFWLLRIVCLSADLRREIRQSISDYHPTQGYRFELSKGKLITSIKISFASSITLITWLIFSYPYGFWATVTCLLIMEEGARQTTKKGGLRFIAHIVSALFGGICALLIYTHIYYLLIPLVISFFICGYIIGLRSSYNSLGNTTGIALAIMLLAAAGTDQTFTVVAARFLNVTYGIVIGLFITHYLLPQNDQSVVDNKG